MAEFRLAEREGTLVRCADVEREHLRIIARILQQMEPIPPRFAAEFAQTDEQRGAMEQRLRDELQRVQPDLGERETHEDADRT